MGSLLPPVTFATLLRRYRQAAGLTQEELAERAHLSAQAIGALERGDRRAPRRETVELLAEALGLAGSARAEFEAAARRRRPVDLDFHPAEQREATLLAAPAGADTNSDQRGAQLDQVWSASPVAAESSLNPRPRTRLSRRLLSVVMVALLGGSALLIRGETGALAGRLPLLCGGSLAIATDLPTSGFDGANGGKATENAVNLAVTQSADLGGGYRLRAINYDDVSHVTGMRDTVTGARNVKRMVTNPCVVGMVGPLYSKLAPDEMLIAASGGLVMVSPGVTNPAMTLRPYANAQDLDFDVMRPPGKPDLFFRVVPNDATQAVADANMVFINLGAKTVYTVTNTGAYGEELVGGFTPAFQVKGGAVVGVDVLGFDSSVIPEIASRIVAAHPDAVFYGGVTSSGAGFLKAQLVNLGYKGWFIGGDGIVNDPAFVTQAGSDGADGAYASLGVRDPSTFTSGAAARFLTDYRARYPGQSPGYYGAYAYDAAMVLIAAIRRVVATGQAVTRAGVATQVPRSQYAGATGEISFDVNGDVTRAVFSIYVVRQGKWTYDFQMNV